MVYPIKKCAGGIQFVVAIQPRSSKNIIVGLHNNRLKIRLTSPPAEGAANRQCIKFLADFLEIGSSRVSIVHGLTGRNKTIKVEGMDAETFLRKIAPVIRHINQGD